MNRERAKELLPIIQSFAEGKEVEMLYKTNNIWNLAPHPSFCDDREWRIKPEPREFWVIESATTESWQAYGFTSEENAKKSRIDKKVIHVREVLDD